MNQFLFREFPLHPVCRGALSKRSSFLNVLNFPVRKKTGKNSMAKYFSNIRFYLPCRKSLLRKRTINEENQPINLFSMILRKGKGLPNAKRGERKIKERWKRRFQSFNLE